MGKLEEIVAGWINVAINVTTEEAQKRSEVCSGCDSAVLSKWIQKVVGEKQLKQIEGYKCNECGCPLSAKVRSDKSICPLGKW